MLTHVTSKNLTCIMHFPYTLAIHVGVWTHLHFNVCLHLTYEHSLVTTISFKHEYNLPTCLYPPFSFVARKSLIDSSLALSLSWPGILIQVTIQHHYKLSWSNNPTLLKMTFENWNTLMWWYLLYCAQWFYFCDAVSDTNESDWFHWPPR